MSYQAQSFQGGAWHAPGRPFSTPAARRVRLSRLGAQVTASTSSAADPTAPISRTIPAHNVVQYTSLYQAGDSIPAALARLTTPAVVQFPDGDFAINDFSIYGGFTGSYFGAWNNRLLGIAGQGKDRTRISIARGTSTRASSVPAQSAGGTNQIYLARVGKADGSTLQNICYDFELDGTDQPVSTANSAIPHVYNGLMNFQPTDSFFKGLRIRGIPGDWNEPPGETFSLNDYKGIRSTYVDCEIDGYNTEGVRRGGGSIGFNNSIDSYVEDCYFHDSLVSGLTWSFTGQINNPGSASSGIETHRVKVERNANHELRAGFRFAAMNHENVLGKIRHYAPDLSRDNMEWNVGLMVFNNYLSDNTDIEIYNPIWKPSDIPVQYNGAYCLQIPPTWGGQPNKQVTPPKVFNKDGSQKQPYVVSAYTGTAVLPINPATQYVLLRA